MPAKLSKPLVDSEQPAQSEAPAERVTVTTPGTIRVKSTSVFVLLALSHLLFFTLGMAMALLLNLDRAESDPSRKARPANWTHRDKPDAGRVRDELDAG